MQLQSCFLCIGSRIRRKRYMLVDLFKKNKYLAQLIYSILIVILIPSALVINTVFLLKSFSRDMDFELNNKALLVESVISSHLKDKLENEAELKSVLDELVFDLPEIRAVEVFRLKDQENLSFTTTASLTRAVYDPVLNHLAFSADKAFSKEINAALGDRPAERMWLVASPMYDENDKKVGVINTYVSAAQIDEITQRTVNDSIKILLITLVVILLLLVNHFSLFERAAAFIKLKEIDNLKDDFISIAAHELKTPLTIIKNYAFLLEKNERIKESPEMLDEVVKILAGSNRLSILVNDLLDVSRIEMNRMKLEMGTQDLREIVTNVINQLVPEAQNKKLSLVYQKCDTPIFVKGDKNKLEQIFINLIGNSIKYTLEGTITVMHELEEKSIKTSIKDTGVGIPPEKMNRLFDKFSRIYNDKTKNVPGTGLGLWITKELTEKMGGKIFVESIENTGTQFSVVFPKVPFSASNTSEIKPAPIPQALPQLSNQAAPSTARQVVSPTPHENANSQAQQQPGELLQTHIPAQTVLLVPQKNPQSS
ncbi:hypothetical protein COY16_03120 [Candidatus Roizmanbacteria bacterium CG_4_10_14_0_2_um_filter_39_13]|uniref:histidine kinase n=1 Tax=Candidatus Roizmanbacteria bacterium CG_4_10_14_0_2_um_filter_39_13 TaxID=1974825 RepID=A0A2M7TYU6_9BACT|nr:MAG: hypothetical protein COY16_03120 [Candidatus Roizmanbacteria bacterium CG_4_10_14_0_2_um_filter_39_13]